MASLIILLLSIVLIPILFFLLFAIPSKFRTTPHPLPPGPRPLPLIGSLHLLGSLPQRSARAMAKIYGPVFFLRLGSSKNAVIITSIPLAEEIMRANDLVFANRPYSEITEFLTYGYKGFAFAEHSPYWRGARKMCVNLLLTPTKIHSYEFVRKQEMAVFVESLKEDAKSRTLVDVTSKVQEVVADIVCRMVFGEKESESGTKISAHYHEMSRIVGAPNISDFVPLLRLFDLQGLRRRARAVKGILVEYLDKTIDHHMKNRGKKGDEKEKDLIDNILECMENKDGEFQFDLIGMKAIILELLVGALDAPVVAVEWALVELMRHPKTLKRLQEELDRVVGRNRAVEESDLPELTYLQMVVKEILRLHQVNPFLIRSAKQDTVVGGFHIPGGTIVMINTWAMARDSEVWANGDDFHPERFENFNIRVSGHDFRLLPYGTGRRGCPGMSFGQIMIPMILAQLVHCFDWELPDGMSPSELDMTEKYGLTMPRKVHLVATPVCRLS